METYNLNLGFNNCAPVNDQANFKNLKHIDTKRQYSMSIEDYNLIYKPLNTRVGNEHKPRSGNI